MSRPDDCFTVTGFKMKDTPGAFSDRPDVIHCECPTNGSLVFIDVIALAGSVLTIQRPHVEVIDIVPVAFLELSMVFRIEHSTVDAAEEETKTSCLPIDGVIGVCTRLGTTYRIKKPTVDLYALEDGLATGSAARHVMTRLNRLPRMLPGNVYERQLSLKPGGDYEIESFCYSPGKLHGNSKMVFESILLNASGADGYSLSVQRQVSALCFMVRRHGYETAMNGKIGGKAIIDIGTGRSQSFSFLSDKSVSMLLCDPELSCLRKLSRRMDRDMTSMDAVSQLAVLKTLYSGKVKTAVFRGRVEDLFNHASLVDYVVAAAIPIVFSFSLSHVHEFCFDTTSEGANVNGCAYFYDEEDSNGKVFDAFGVKMDVVDSFERQGRFQFGEDRSFTEHAITLKMMRGLEVESAMDIIKRCSEIAPDVELILRHVCVFMTKV